MDYETLLARQEQLRHKHTVEEASFTAYGDNPFCGDSIRISGDLDDEGRIAHLGFDGYACAVCEVTADLLVECSLGKTPDQMLAMEPAAAEGMLGIELPRTRKQCAQLPLDTLKRALGHFREPPE